jgi:hypothetical protein
MFGFLLSGTLGIYLHSYIWLCKVINCNFKNRNAIWALVELVNWCSKTRNMILSPQSLGLTSLTYFDVHVSLKTTQKINVWCHLSKDPTNLKMHFSRWEKLSIMLKISFSSTQRTFASL